MGSGTKKYQNTSEGSTSGQKVIDRFAQMMIERMEKMKGSSWEKGWIVGEVAAGLPKNIANRNYSGSNSFFLQLESAMKGYRLPIFMTFKQAHDLNSHVLKGEKSFPVAYWDFMIKDKFGSRISEEDYKNLSKEEKREYKVIPFIKSFPVYNIDQTNFKEIHPDKYEAFLKDYSVGEIRDTNGMYQNAAIDNLIQKNEWVCPIKADDLSSRAYYSPSRDIIVVPTKAQFNKGGDDKSIYDGGMEYYSTLMHEMSHSTGTPERLNRDKGGKFGDARYAKEELVAELTAAMLGQTMGFSSKITDNSAAYLDSWISVLKSEPKFILSVMADVNKSSEMILDYVDKQRLSLGETPYLQRNNAVNKQIDEKKISFSDITILKTKSGEFGINASLNGTNLGIKTISEENASTYFKLKDRPEQSLFLMQLANKNFKNEIAEIHSNVKTSRAI